MGWESWLSVDVLWHGKYREYWGSTIGRDSVKNCNFWWAGRYTVHHRLLRLSSYSNISTILQILFTKIAKTPAKATETQVLILCLFVF